MSDRVGRRGQFVRAWGPGVVFSAMMAVVFAAWAFGNHVEAQCDEARAGCIAQCGTRCDSAQCRAECDARHRCRW